MARPEWKRSDNDDRRGENSRQTIHRAVRAGLRGGGIARLSCATNLRSIAICAACSQRARPLVDPSAPRVQPEPDPLVDPALESLAALVAAREIRDVELGLDRRRADDVDALVLHRSACAP